MANSIMEVISILSLPLIAFNVSFGRRGRISLLFHCRSVLSGQFLHRRVPPSFWQLFLPL